MVCPFCQKEKPVRIEINSLDLRICPHCKASFLPASQLPDLRRNLANTTKSHWIRVLSAHKGKIDSYDNLFCIEHKEPLEKQTIPGFSFEGFIAKCCSLLHLHPEVMEKILALGLSPEQARPQKGGLARFLGSFLFRILEKRHAEDEIDRLQYDTKFRHVLEPGG